MGLSLLVGILTMTEKVETGHHANGPDPSQP